MIADARLKGNRIPKGNGGGGGWGQSSWECTAGEPRKAAPEHAYRDEVSQGWGYDVHAWNRTSSELQTVTAGYRGTVAGSCH